MADKPNGASYVIVQRPVSDLSQLLRDIRHARFTGSLTVHFSEGIPAGHIELKQKASAPALSISYLERLAE